MHMDPFTHDLWKKKYVEDEELNEVCQQLQGQVCVEGRYTKVYYHIEDGFLYKAYKLVFLKVKDFN